MARTIPCGDDVDAVVEAVRPYVDAGFGFSQFAQGGKELLLGPLQVRCLVVAADLNEGYLGVYTAATSQNPARARRPSTGGTACMRPSGAMLSIIVPPFECENQDPHANHLGSIGQRWFDRSIQDAGRLIAGT